MKPNYGSVVSFCTSSMQNTASERQLKSGYCSKTCSYGSNIYKSESERPSLQKIVAEGTRIDRLYLGKFIPLRERKLLQKLMATRAVYDDAINECLSMSVGEVKAPRQNHPCQCNFDDCESLMKLMSRSRMQKYKQSKSRLQHRLSKGFKKSLNKMKVSKQKHINMEDWACDPVCDPTVCKPTECLTKNMKRQDKRVGRKYSKHGAGLVKCVTISSMSTDSMAQTRQKRSDENVETRKKKMHHKHSASVIKPKVNVNIGSKKKKQITKKEGISQRKNINKSQTKSFVKSASTISSDYRKETKMIGDNNKIIDLKRCLCNLKPKASVPKKVISKGSMTSYAPVKLQKESTTKTETTKHKEHINQTKADRALKRCFCTLKIRAKRKLTKQVSQESMTARIPAVRKPPVREEASVTDNRVHKAKQASKESMTSRSSGIYKQQVREQGSLTENRSNQNQEAWLPSSCECLRLTKKHPKLSSTESRKTKSAFSLTPKYVTPTKAKRVQSSIVTRKSSITKSKTRGNVARMPREIRSSRSVSYRHKLLEVCIESPKDERIQSVSYTAPKPKPRKKNNRVRLAETYGSQGDTRLESNDRVGSALKRCFCSLKLHNAYKNKQKNHSSSYKEKMHRQQTDSIPHKTKHLATSSSRRKGKFSRRAVKISSSFSFDINLCRDIPPVAHTRLVQNDVKNKITEPTRSVSSHESQTEIPKKTDNAALVKPMVKRCFCTLQLYEKQQQERAKRERPKVYNVNRLTVANTKPFSRKIQNTVIKKNERHPFVSQLSLKMNALNKEISTLQLKKSKNNCSSKPTFQLVRLSSDLSFKLTHTCKPLQSKKNIPFSNRFFYAMNVRDISQYKSEPKNQRSTSVSFDCDDYQKLNVGKPLSKTSMSLFADIASKSAANIPCLHKNQSQLNDISHTTYLKRCSIKQGVPCHQEPSHFCRQDRHTKSICGSKIDCLKFLSSYQRKLKTRPNEEEVKYQSDNVHAPSTFDQNTDQKLKKYWYKNYKPNTPVVNKAIDVSAKPKRNKGKDKQRYATKLAKNRASVILRKHNHLKDKLKQMTASRPVLNQYDCTSSLCMPKETALCDAFECHKRRHKRVCDREPRASITDVPFYVRTDSRPPKVNQYSPKMEIYSSRAIKNSHATQRKRKYAESPQAINVFESNKITDMVSQQPTIFKNHYTKQYKTNVVLENKLNLLNNYHLKQIRIRDSQILTKKIKSTISAINPFLKQCFNNIKIQIANNTIISDTKNPPGKRLCSANDDYNRGGVCNETESKKRKSLLNVASLKNCSGKKKSIQCNSYELKKRTEISKKRNEVLLQQKNNMQPNKAKIKTHNDWKSKPYVFDPYVYLLEKCELYNKGVLKNAGLYRTRNIKSYKSKSGVRSTGQFSTNKTISKIRKTTSAMNEYEKNYQRNNCIMNSPILFNGVKTENDMPNCKRTKVSPISIKQSLHSRSYKNVPCAKSASKTYSPLYKPVCRENKELRNITSQNNKANIRNVLRRCFDVFKIQNDKLSRVNKSVNAMKQQRSYKIETPITQVPTERIARHSKKIYTSSKNLREKINLQGQYKHKLDKSQNKKQLAKKGRSQKLFRNHEVLTIFPYTPKKIQNIFSKTRFISNKRHPLVTNTEKNQVKNNLTTEVEENIHSSQRYPDTSIKTMFRCITQFFRKGKSQTIMNINLCDKSEISPISYNKVKEKSKVTGGSLKISKSDRPVTNLKTTPLHKKTKSVNSSKIPGKNTHYKKYSLLTDRKVKTYSRFQSGDAGITETIPRIRNKKKTNIISHSHNQITCMYCRAQYDNKPIESIKINYLEGSNPARDISGARKVKDIKAQKLILLPTCVKECNPKICATHMTRPCPCISPKIETNLKKPKRKDCCCFDKKPYCGPLELTEEQRRISRKQVKRDDPPPPPDLPPHPLPARGPKYYKIGRDTSIVSPPTAGGKGRLSKLSSHVDEAGETLDGTDAGTVQPGVVQPGVVRPSIAQPGVVRPSVVQPGVVRPSVVQPGVVRPSVVQPGVFRPSVVQPGVVQPGVVQPGVVRPSVVQPGVVQHGVVQHGGGGIGEQGGTAVGGAQIKSKLSKKKGKNADRTSVVQPVTVQPDKVPLSGIGAQGETAGGEAAQTDGGKGKSKLSKKKGKKGVVIGKVETGGGAIGLVETGGGTGPTGGVETGVSQLGGVGGADQTADRTVNVGKVKSKKKKGKVTKAVTDIGAVDTGVAITVEQDTGPTGTGVTETVVTEPGTKNAKKGMKSKAGKENGVQEIIKNAVCVCDDDEYKLTKNPIKNYMSCLRHINKPLPPPPPPPPPEPVEYMDPEPLFEMKLMADTMDLINPHDVMFKVQQLRSSLKYHPEELLKRLQKIHGLACRCCICVAVEQAALRKQQALQKKGTKRRRKNISEREKKKNLAEKLALLNRNPCICGSKKCQQLLNEICTNELKLQEMKKIVPCVCGTKICAQERMKEDVKRKLITKESMRQSIREKERQKRELKQKHDFETRQARYKREDKQRRQKRKKIDKEVTKRVQKQIKTTPDVILACESLVDIGKLGVTTVFNLLRSIYKKAIHPMDAYKTLTYSYKEPGRWKSSLQSAWVDSGATSVAKRIWLRITGMQKTQDIKEKIDNNAAAGYLVHVFDPDEKRRLKYLKKHMAMKRKALRKREPMDYECSLFMASQRRRPYLSVYYRCPWFYPHCISLINLWRQCTDVLLFLLAVLVWSPCILCMELFRALVCCTGCTA